MHTIVPSFTMGTQIGRIVVKLAIADLCFCVSLNVVDAYTWALWISMDMAT
jgi:hypothetical protein